MTESSFTAIIEREGDVYVVLRPQLDVASQGSTAEEATANLKETVELFLDSAEASEVSLRLREPVFVTRLEITRLHGFPDPRVHARDPASESIRISCSFECRNHRPQPALGYADD